MREDAQSEREEVELRWKERLKGMRGDVERPVRDTHH